MIDKNELLGGLTGSFISFSGIAIADVDHIVNIVTGVLGFLLTLVAVVIIPMIKWYKKSKADGKITADEVIEGLETLSDGATKINDELKKLDNKDKTEIDK